MAEPATTSPPLTFEAAAQLDPDLWRGEIVNGVWVPVSNNTWRHGEIRLNIALLLKQYTRSHPEWRAAVGDPGTRLSRNPDTLRGPDAAVLRATRRPGGTGVEGWVEGAPEVTIEIVGDSQAAVDLLNKSLEYLQAGTQLALVVDGAAEKVMLLTPPNCIRILGIRDTLDCSDALPGFSCTVAEIFE